MSPLNPHSASPRNESVLITLISACLFLFVGFGLGLRGASSSQVYNVSVEALVWGARFVGIGLLVVIGLILLRLPGVLTLDLTVSAVASIGCLLIGAIWLAHSDMQGLLLLLFGLFNASSLRIAWARWRLASGSSPRGEE